MDALGWDRRCLLLTNHALVLSVIAEEPTVRIREIAERVEITERAVESLLADLISVGFLSRKRVGRRNAYQVHGESRLRHPLVSEGTVSGLLGAIAPGHWPATPEPAFAHPDTGTDSPEETLSCGDRREQSMLRAATSSTKEGVTMKRVLVYMVVASLLAFATAALAATTGGHHKLQGQLRHPGGAIQGLADSQGTDAAGVASASAGVTGHTARKVGPAKVSTTATAHGSARQDVSKGSAGSAVNDPPASAGGSSSTTVGVGKTGVSVSAGKGGVGVGVSPAGGKPISVGVSPPGSGQPPITIGGKDPLSGLGL